MFGETLKKTGKMHLPLNNNLENINIIVMGKSGVGKSTLINNVFHENVTKVGYGEPITDKIIKIKNKNIPLTIYDTPGLELDQKQQQSLLKQFEKIINDNSKSEKMNDHIHCIWYCINSQASSFENAEIQFIKKIANDFQDKIPVILILTQCYNNKNKVKMIQRIEKEKMNLTVVPVVAEDYHMDIDVLGISVSVPSYGLDDLVDKMAICLPEIMQNVFLNTQKVSLKHKKYSAYITVLEASAAAAAIAGSPAPIGKISFLIKAEKKMIERINSIYFGENDKNSLFSFLNDTIIFSLFQYTEKIFMNTNNNEKTSTNTIDAIFGVLNRGGLISAGCSGVITAAIGITCTQIAQNKYKNIYAFDNLSKQQFEDYFFELYYKNIIEIDNDPMKITNYLKDIKNSNKFVY